jgi:CarD family transcriptional regulator
VNFKIGDKVVYPNHGVGVIEKVDSRTIGELSSSFYCLRILSTDSTVMVPVGNTANVGLRKLLSRRAVTKVLKTLKEGEVATYDDWKGRFQANSDKMRTGDVEAVSEVFKSLTILNEVKPLSYRERKMLDRARFLLISELSEASGKTPESIEKQVDSSLEDSLKGLNDEVEH